jgi:hypothetical protein
MKMILLLLVFSLNLHAQNVDQVINNILQTPSTNSDTSKNDYLLLSFDKEINLDQINDTDIVFVVYQNVSPGDKLVLVNYLLKYGYSYQIGTKYMIIPANLQGKSLIKTYKNS